MISDILFAVIVSILGLIYGSVIIGQNGVIVKGYFVPTLGASITISILILCISVIDLTLIISTKCFPEDSVIVTNVKKLLGYNERHLQGPRIIVNVLLMSLTLMFLYIIVA